jgi:hypothetical protein
MKKSFILLLVFSGCANLRHVPVTSTPIHTLSTYDQVIANWGPARDCRELRDYRYCEIEEKGIVVFKENKYFTTLEKDEDASDLEVQVLLKGRPIFQKKLIYLGKTRGKSWDTYGPYIHSILHANNLVVSDRPVAQAEQISASFGKSSLALKAKSWSLTVKGSGKQEWLMPAMASAASDSLFAQTPSPAFKFNSNSVQVKSFKHFSKLYR